MEKIRSNARYHQNKKCKKGNTGDSADDEPSEDSVDFVEWELGKHLSFLQRMSEKYPRK